jgi:hypothetical protein
MIRRTCIQFSWLLLIANILFGCKSKESLPAAPSSGALNITKNVTASFAPPQWINVVNGAGETLQVAQIAGFGEGCPHAGDPDIDGKYTEGCPVRSDKWSNLSQYAQSIMLKKTWESGFKYSIRDQIKCENDIQRPFHAYALDSIVAFVFEEYFDSIEVSHENGVAHIDFKGYVNPENRGYPKLQNSNDAISDGGMADSPETILILKTKNRLDRIEMVSCPLPRSTTQFVPRSFPQSVAWV